MNGQVEVKQRTLRTIENPLMVNAQVLQVYINFALMYTADHILPVLQIKDLINKDSNTTTLFKLATDTKPSISHLLVLFCPYVVRKATAYVGTKALNIRQQGQKVFTVSLLVFHSIKKNSLFMYHTERR